MKKIIPVLVLCLFMGGCGNYEEIEDAILVSGLAVDKGEGDNYRVTVETVDLNQKEGEPPATGLITSEGPTVYNALENINSAASKRLFFSQARVLVISEEVAREGLINIIDVIVRDNQLRITNDVVVAKDCTAAELFNMTGNGNPVRAYEIADLLKNESESLSIVPEVKVYELINIIGSSGVAAILPTVGYFESEEKKSIAVSGTAIFTDDRLTEFLNTENSKIMCMIQGETSEAIISEPIRTDTREYMTVKIFNSKTKVKHREENGKIIMDIYVNAEVGINELTARENVMDKQGREELMQKLEKSIADNIGGFVKFMQQGSGADVFGFGERIYKQNPKLWSKIKDTDYFKNIEVQPHIKVKLLGTGFISKSPSSADFRLKEE